jgi:hypothetical protein
LWVLIQEDSLEKYPELTIKIKQQFTY